MISVIVPSLNEEKYIEDTLKALRNQDYKAKYEIIVVDGGSKDKTVKIAKKFADKVIVMGRGVSKARNAGARAAKGEVLLFVDADTVLLFNTMSELEKQFKDKDVVGATCPTLPIIPQAKDFILYWAFNQFVRASIKARRPNISGFCFACRKYAFKKIGGYNEELNVGEDFDMSKRLSKLGKIKFTEDTMVLTSPRRIENWGRIKGIGKYLRIYLKKMVGITTDVDFYKPFR